MHLEAPKLYVFNKKWQATFFAFFDHRLKIFFSLCCKMPLFPTALSAENPRFRIFCCQLDNIKKQTYRRLVKHL